MQQGRLELDSSVRRVSHGIALLGGSPFRLIRLSSAGSKLLDCWLAGGQAQASPQATALRKRLLAAAMVHPAVVPASSYTGMTVVVPVYDDGEGLRELLQAVRVDAPGVPVIVVDDASPSVEAIAAIARDFDAQLLLHPDNRGPGAGRNTGWRHAQADGAEVVCFLDSDVVPKPRALATLLAHFADPDVAAVAGRVRATSSAELLASYEATDSPLDMGPNPALVQPGTRMSYVPSAALAVRVGSLETLGGFDEGLRYGEDVDFVWRLTDMAGTVRYEPRAEVEHRNRSSFADFARQRHGYGSAAAPLAKRHGNKVAPLQFPALTSATALAALVAPMRFKLCSLLVGALRSVALSRKLEGKVTSANVEAARLTAMSHGYAAQGLATAATRTWAPLLLLTKRSRRVLLLATVVPALVDWIRQRPSLDPASHVAVRAVDHGAYCSGVWTGVLKHRSLVALLPSLRRQPVNSAAGRHR